MALSREEVENLLLSLEEVRSIQREYADRFTEIESLCLFVGYPKSGHSLVGALLDAHPDIVIAHELDFLRGLRAGLSRDALFALLLETSAGFMRDGNVWNGYSYFVANQWQGRFRNLKVIGDKKGGATSRQLLLYPKVLERLQTSVVIPIKFIHVIRHPAHNIAGISREFDIPLEQAAKFYFAEAEAVARHKTQISTEDLHEIHYEDFIRDPPTHLTALCKFLGQQSAMDYLEDCAAIVKPVDHNSHPSPAWPTGMLQAVAGKAARYEFLADYPFD